MIIDRGAEFPSEIQQQLDSYGRDMWHFRDRTDGNPTLRAKNLYRGADHRGFAYLTDKIRITPRQFTSTPLARPKYLHFVCSPLRAAEIMAEAEKVEGWHPITIYEPIPDSCVPAELPNLEAILDRIDVLSPNAEEAFSFLSVGLPVTREKVEAVANSLVKGVKKAVLIRSGALGSFTLSGETRKGRWVEAYWTTEDDCRVKDVTGAGNSFLGGLVGGLEKTSGDIFEASLYAAVSASFTIEQSGLPVITISDSSEKWNGDDPYKRLEDLWKRTGLPSKA